MILFQVLIDRSKRMKKSLISQKITTVILASALVMGVVSCSSGKSDKSDETTAVRTTEAETVTEETSEETSEETTVETTEETTTETTEESDVATGDPEIDQFEDPEVRKWAKYYLDEGYKIREIGDESFFGPHSDMIEGFAAGTDDDNILTLDFVMKFPDYESADTYLDRVDEGKRGPVVRTDNGDGSYDIDIHDGVWTGTLSANNVLRLVCNKR